MSSSYGIAGSNPVSDYSSRINVLLCDAIRNHWNLDIHGTNTAPIPYPSADDDILWLNTWFVGQRDIELIFRHSFLDKPVFGRTTDWRYQPVVETVDCHIFVRGAGGDVEPATLNTVVNGLEKIVALNHTMLVPNAVVEVASTQPAPATKGEDDLQSLWHVLMKIRVMYWKVRTI